MDNLLLAVLRHNVSKKWTNTSYYRQFPHRYIFVMKRTKPYTHIYSPQHDPIKK